MARLANVTAANLGQIERQRYIPPEYSRTLKKLALVVGLPTESAATLLDEVDDDGE
jgi:hypothetical protein